MTLREQQSDFVRLIGKLIEYAYAMGYELTFGEALRTPEQAAIHASSGRGISNSLHIDRLAIDFNLFKNGAYLDTSEAHRPLGIYWVSLDARCRWGGDFTRPDGNHYSMTWGGRA